MIIKTISIVILTLQLILSANPALAQAKASKATAKEKTAATEKPLWTYGSLMFDKKTSEWIKEAIKSHEQQIPLEILLPGLFPSTAAPAIDKPIDTPIETAPVIAATALIPDVSSYYLKSILYFSPNQWSIWINNQKISESSEHTIGELNIINVTRDQVTFLWGQSKIEQLFPTWKDSFIKTENNKYISPYKNIVVDAASGNISLILKPNQTLITKTLEIIEGSAGNVAAATGSPSATATTPTGNTPNGTTNATAKPTESDMLTDAVKNIETLKSILNQNVENLR